MDFLHAELAVHVCDATPRGGAPSAVARFFSLTSRVNVGDFYSLLFAHLRRSGAMDDVIAAEWEQAAPSRPIAALALLAAATDRTGLSDQVQAARSGMSIAGAAGARGGGARHLHGRGVAGPPPLWLAEAERVCLWPIDRRVLELQLTRGGVVSLELPDAAAAAAAGQSQALVLQKAIAAGELASKLDTSDKTLVLAVESKATPDVAGTAATTTVASASQPTELYALASFTVPFSSIDGLVTAIFSELRAGTVPPGPSAQPTHAECRKRPLVGIACAACRATTLSHLLNIMQVL
jgi:hypothetical protein